MLINEENMEKIDFVITWVDGNDEKWIKEKEKWSLNKKTDDSTFNNGQIILHVLGIGDY